jgi:tetraacyldisaccharide 4'-kinase
MLVFSAGSDVAPALTGDEAQIFLHAGKADLGIGADRAETGRLLLSRIKANVFLLDDGFQHARLKRDIDIVLVDGIDPFGGGEVLPLGRLREPLNALKRADVFVVTRIQANQRYRAICAELQRYNPTAPVFMAATITRRWRLCRAGGRLDAMIQGRRAAAFCGIGNPQAFWNTLDLLGVEVVFRWTFGDHHLYTPRELHRLKLQAQAAGADVLITTEKDRMNLPPDVEAFVAPLEIAWLQIEYSLDREAEFLHLLETKLNLPVATGAPG